jgi:hypothetical protein
MADLVMFIGVYYGGFILAAICVGFAIRKRSECKTAIWFLIAGAVLALAQLALWMVVVESGNAV